MWNSPLKKPSKRTNKKNGSYRSTVSSSSLNPSTIMPFSIDRKLSYVDSTIARNNPGGSYLVYGIRINDLYDPDPLILSGSITGFKELMQFYTRYRVHHNEIEVSLSNLETFPIAWGLCFGQQNIIGTIGSAAQALNVLENGFTTGARILSGKGGQDRDRVVCKINLKDLVGNKTAFEGDLDYTGTINTSPAISLWCFVVVVSTTGASLTNGVSALSKFTYSSHLFDRVELNA